MQRTALEIVLGRNAGIQIDRGAVLNVRVGDGQHAGKTAEGLVLAGTTAPL